MSRLESKLTEQFYAWEARGRGLQLWKQPVSPEPAFRHFPGHVLKENPIPDDGRSETFLSALVQKISRRLTNEPEEVPSVMEKEAEPEPKAFERSAMIELCASLPSTTQVSKEVFEQLLSSLMNCREPIAFELIGTPDAVTTQIVTAESDSDLVRHQFEAHFPEAVFTRQTAFLENAWTQTEAEESVIFEFGLSREFMLPIAAARNFGIDPYIGLIAALSNIRENELALFQVIFEPVRRPWNESILRSVTDGSGKDFFVNRPELAREAKTKISRPLFAAVVRIAVKSNSRLLDIAIDLAGALTVFSNPSGNELVPLNNSGYHFAEHEEDLLRRQSRRSGTILNSEELTALVHLPSSSVRAPKLKREAQKTKAAPRLATNSAGLFLGTNTHAGITSEVRLDSEQRVRHLHCIGATGTGKSTLLFNLIKQDIESGQGLAVIDPHGDLIDKILGSIPEHRIDDVVLIDPADEDFAVGFNVLSAHSELEKNLLASDLTSTFQRLSTSWGDQMTGVLNNAILAFLESRRGGTLADLQRFLIDPAFRNEFLQTVADSQVHFYWKKAFPQLTGSKSIGPLLTRLGSFLDRKPIRHMVTQKENRLNFAEIMDTGKIFLAKLSQGLIGNGNAYLLGTFLISKFQQIAMSRQAQAASTRRDFWCYCDEFSNFLTPSMAQILTGARKYRLGLVLVHQELRQAQRDPEVASAVLAAPYTRICFRVGDDDARKLADGFTFFESKDLQKLPNFQAICRVERSDCDFNLSIPYPAEPDETQAAEIRQRVITASREKYAVPRKQIEAEQAAAFVEIDEPPSARKEKTPLNKQSFKSEPIPLPDAITPVEKEKGAPEPLVNQLLSNVTNDVVNKPKTAPPDPGRGGAQHKAIQHRLKTEAKKLGFGTTIEKEILDGQGSVDLFVERGEQMFACEISFTTTIDHEVGNVIKCLKAGYRQVCVICTEQTRLEKIQTAITNCLSAEEAACIRYFQPEEFLAHLRKLALQPLPPPPPETKVLLGKYKVKTKHPNLAEAERERKEKQVHQMMSEAMKERKS